MIDDETPPDLVHVPRLPLVRHRPEDRWPTSRRLFVGSVISAAINLVASLTHPWNLVPAAAMILSALVFWRIRRRQRATR